MYRESNIVTTIKVRRLERASHLVRMSEERTIKKVSLVKPDERRKAYGCPRSMKNRWSRGGLAGGPQWN